MSDDDLKFRVYELECKLELRDKRVADLSKRVELAEIERDRWKAVAENAVESENITIEKLTLAEIDLDLERQQRQKVELLLETEKSLTAVLEDVVKATAKMRSQV